MEKQAYKQGCLYKTYIIFYQYLQFMQPFLMFLAKHVAHNKIIQKHRQQTIYLFSFSINIFSFGIKSFLE